LAWASSSETVALQINDQTVINLQVYINWGKFVCLCRKLFMTEAHSQGSCSWAFAPIPFVAAYSALALARARSGIATYAAQVSLKTSVNSRRRG
jgi:hypothetical protein